MRIKISTLRQLIREAIEEMSTTCTQGANCECSQCSGMSEVDEKDKDKDGDKDFADIQIARMTASGMPMKDAVKKSRKHDESVK